MKNLNIAYFKNKTVFVAIYSKRENNNNQILKQWDIILKHFGFIHNNSEEKCFTRYKKYLKNKNSEVSRASNAKTMFTEKEHIQ